MAYTIAAAHVSQMNPLDVHYLYKLRVDVFVHEQQCPYAEIDNTDIHPDTVQLLARQETENLTELAGTCRVFPANHPIDAVPQDVMQFGRFALAADARGTGLGRQLMEAALQLCEHIRPGLPVFLEAQAPLTGYYSQYGFEVCGEQFLEDGIPHVPMVRHRANAAGIGSR